MAGEPPTTEVPPTFVEILVPSDGEPAATETPPDALTPDPSIFVVAPPGPDGVLGPELQAPMAKRTAMMGGKPARFSFILQYSRNSAFFPIPGVFDRLLGRCHAEPPAVEPSLPPTLPALSLVVQPTLLSGLDPSAAQGQKPRESMRQPIADEPAYG